MTGKLNGKRILVTRPAAQAGELVAMIEAQGGEAVRFPLLEIGPAENQQPLIDAGEHLDDYALAVFISPNAVDYSLSLMLSRKPWPASLRAAAVGPGTAVRLNSFGVENVIVPSGRFDSEALLDLAGLQEGALGGRKVLILRGNGGRELLAETLLARGARVDCIACYCRSAPVDATPLVSLLYNKGLDALTVSSSEGLRNLWTLLDTENRQRLRMLPLFVPHPRIAESASGLGLQNVVLTGPADAGIIDGLIGFDWQPHE